MPELRYEARVYPLPPGTRYDGYTLALGIRSANSSSEAFRPIYYMGDAELRQLVQAVNKFAVENGNA